MQFVTVEKTSPEYRRYLRGHLSAGQRAIPIPSQEFESATATFQILSLGELEQRPLWYRLLRLYRPELTAFTVLPVWLVCFLVKGAIVAQINLILAALFFHGAIFAFNDYYDHMQGVDRMSDRRGSRLIQTGQFRALDVLKLAWLYWGIAVLTGLPIIWQRPGVLAFLLCGLGLATLGSTYSRFGFKAIALSDLMIFLCLGPLLTASVSYALSQTIPLSVLVLGSAFGLTAVLYVQARHLSTAMSDYRAGVQTTVVRLGFDRAKMLFVIELFLIFGKFAFFTGQMWDTHGFVLAWTLLFIGALSVWLLKEIWEVRSPLSGAAEQLSTQICRYQFFVAVLLLLALQ